MRAILKRHLDSKTLFIGANRPASLEQLAAPVLSQGNQMSCSHGIKLLLVRSPPQGIEQTSTRSRTNDPGRQLQKPIKQVRNTIDKYQDKVDNAGPCIHATPY